MSAPSELSVWRQLRKMDRASILREAKGATLTIAILGVCVILLAYSALAILNVHAVSAYIIVLLLAAIVGAAAGFWRHMKTMLNYGLLYPLDPAERLKRRVIAINATFSEAATLMSDLQRDLAAQQAAREVLVAQAEEQQRLLEVNEEQAEKIRQILIGETKATIRAERRQQWMFFALGVVVSIPIGVMINLFVP
ncbi:hypothetical protein [Nonomuraea wenchangensis]|uniref:hypothetical protein n=1 Tax=Nonomuraea wenchangensis TaxID=568860 RepID=UPI003317E26B